MISRKVSWVLLVTTTVAVVALAVPDYWPQYKHFCWSLAVVSIALSAHYVIKQPDNYRALYTSTEGLYFEGVGGKYHVKWVGVERVEYVREPNFFVDPTGGYLESAWLVSTKDAGTIQIPDEWPHRRKLLRAFSAYVRNFNHDVARQAISQKFEGKWLCN